MFEAGSDLHQNHRMSVGLFDHPYHSVTGPDGAFRFVGLPAGTYVVAAWHEKLGEVTETITISEKDATPSHRSRPHTARLRFTSE